MALLLDTDQIDSRDRAEMLTAAFAEASAQAHLAYNPAAGAVRGRFDSWQLGPARIERASFSAVHITRTSKHIRNSPSPFIGAHLAQRKPLRMTHAETQQKIEPGQLFLADLDLTYEADWYGGQVSALFVPRDHLDLPGETIHAALLQPQRSPLYNMVANHIASTISVGDMVTNDPAAPTLGDACVEMVRAFLISAAGHGTEDGTALPDNILLAQIRDYVNRRLPDPDLNPAEIARAHHISIRYLYKLCANAGLSLEQWIISQRLERAHNDLARHDRDHWSIAAIAIGSGFRSHSHFTRRLFAAYGVAPSQWRREALEHPSARMQSNAAEP
ncbi:helix-turn-helix domain-containing protein [Nocardia sp. CA-128927]|uniref:helix-turn-helix domain-containing protein n=1 Tax=Nocardia sp. CA-128927 TaxID=3239975 RepID=UPI003D953465